MTEMLEADGPEELIVEHSDESDPPVLSYDPPKEKPPSTIELMISKQLLKVEILRLLSRFADLNSKDVLKDLVQEFERDNILEIKEFLPPGLKVRAAKNIRAGAMVSMDDAPIGVATTNAKAGGLVQVAVSSNPKPFRHDPKLHAESAKRGVIAAREAKRRKNGKPWKDRIADVLSKHGDLKATEIREKLGLPDDSSMVSSTLYVMKQDKTVLRNDDGTWSLKP